MEQKQVLDNLYALRAGLSVISQQYDKVLAIEDECDKKLLQNAGNLSGVPTYGNYPQLNKLKERYEDKAFNRWLAFDESTQLFQRNLVNAEQSKNSVEQGWYDNHWAKYKQKSKRNFKLSITFFVLAAVFSVITVIACLAYGTLIKSAFSEVDASVYFLPAIYLVPMSLVFLILGIVLICSSKRNKKAHKHEVEKEEIKVRQAAEMLELLPEVRENARAILNEKDEKIAPVKETSNEYYMALRKQFSSLLDERDWKNLDLVIYELETRRADSIKEALQLVDRELQTERIQQTIVQATEQICYEIRRGFAEMRETIIECSRVISAQLSAVSLQLEGISGQLAELTDSVNMANALQAKANVTSEQLLSDVHAIRYYQ